MKKSSHLVCTILVSCLLLSLSYAQQSTTTELEFEVNKVYPTLIISKEKLDSAHTLLDLNKYYEADWVKAYESVETSVYQNGILKKTISKDINLTEEQKEFLAAADKGRSIEIKVHYLPKNTLKDNPIKEINFSFNVYPQIEAEFPGGQEKLNAYLKANAIDKLPTSSLDEEDLTAIYFTITEEGKVVDVEIYDTTKFNRPVEKKIHNILVEAICNMPDWSPATYSTGAKEKQSFILTVGNHKSCILNLLNIYHG